MEIRLGEKQTQVLKAVVTSYISCGRPVGSMQLWGGAHVGFSPAGIRSVMAELEAAGLLRKPHVSAGRVPTERGYRFYVDRFARPVRPGALEIKAIRKAMNRELSADEMLRDVAKLLESFSHMISAVVVPAAQSDERRSSRNRYMVHVAGTANAVSGSADLDAARLLLAALENREAVIRAVIADDVETGVHVRIGSENKDEPMKRFAVVSSPYWVRGAKGAIALIGPLSMQYPRIIGLTEFASREIAGFFSEGGGRF